MFCYMAMCCARVCIINTFGVFVECGSKLTSSASFSSKAVTKTCHLDGQLLLRQDLVHVHSTQRHLSGSCQAQRRILHTIHLQQGSLLREEKPTPSGDHDGSILRMQPRAVSLPSLDLSHQVAGWTLPEAGISSANCCSFQAFCGPHLLF